jgi:hypothetical protein
MIPLSLLEAKIYAPAVLPGTQLATDLEEQNGPNESKISVGGVLGS